MKFEWDDNKNKSNIQKHGVSFEDAKQALLDSYALTNEDIDTNSEIRFITLGMGAKSQVLLVVWTLRNENVRLISAWKANQPQRRLYEQQF